MAQNDIRTVLSQHPTIPVVTFHHTDEVAPKMEGLIAKGIFCIEITLRTPVAYDCIALAKKLYGDRCAIGMGTVVKVEQIEKAIELGIDFMVSPGLNASLAPHFEQSKIAFIPGVATPSEIIEGIQFGWDTFKFFPANLFGGLGALKAELDSSGVKCSTVLKFHAFAQFEAKGFAVSIHSPAFSQQRRDRAIDIDFGEAF
jgi:2-dehydro-3-deoxyphosphogluconate aldolase/(4S)-4-hydroxy-2-oxoglutarate aldolase